MLPSTPLERIYDDLWQTAKVDLARNALEYDPLPMVGSMRWGVSAIIRPAADVAATLTTIAQQVAEYAGPGQIVYDQASLHTTICSLEPYREQIGADDDRIQRYLDVLTTVARQIRPLQLNYSGLTATRLGVLAQGWPVGADVQRVRQLIQATLHAQHLLTEPATTLRQTAHASLLVFVRPVAAPTALVECIAQQRHTVYGTTTATAIELVRYERTVAHARPIRLATIRLLG